MNERYSRQILFRPIGENGQQKIRKSHVLLIGCGALGSSNAENLVRAGIGKLKIVDRDYVELSNLQRQQLYTEEDVELNLPKAIAAKKRLEKINSEVEIEAFVMDASYSKLEKLVNDVDLIIDSTDNFDIRLILNDICQKFKIPWIYGSCVGSTGMTYTILPGETPCLNCLLDSIPVSGTTCDSVGVISPAVSFVAALQTTEALKLLVEDHSHLRSKLITFDLWNNYFQMINVERAKKEDCPSCGNKAVYPHLQYEAETKSEVLCGRNTVQIRRNREVNLQELANALKNIGKLKINDYLLSIEYQSFRLVFFRDGRTLIHGTNSVEKAKSIYYQLVG